jgi:hypothetical protein
MNETVQSRWVVIVISEITNSALEAKYNHTFRYLSIFIGYLQFANYSGVSYVVMCVVPR